MNIFFNKSLQHTHSKVEKLISNHLQKLDAISNDIKKIEEVLTKAGISIDYEYLFDESPVIQETYTDQFNYSTLYFLQTNHLIVWRREKKRLMYETHAIYFDIEDRNLCRPSQPKITVSKPVIECRAHIRLKLEPELDFFYQGIESLLGQGFLEEKFRLSSPTLTAKKNLEDEIPF